MNKIATAVSLGFLVAFSASLFAREPLTFEERVKAQEAIERVYYNHRIWPKENPQSKPPFEKMVTKEQIEAKVTDYLKKSAALEKFWYRPITGEQLQAEMERITRQTKDASTLNELFAALDNDPILIAECLARPILADRLVRNWYANDERFHEETREKAETALETLNETNFCAAAGAQYSKTTYKLRADQSSNEEMVEEGYGTIFLSFEEFEKLSAETPEAETISPIQETNELFTITHTITKFEAEIQVETLYFQKTSADEWLKESGIKPVLPTTAMNSESYFIPPMPEADCTDSWTPTAGNVPEGRNSHIAIWTGTEMIVWGGWDGTVNFNTGGRYNPSIDTWLSTSIGPNVPTSRRNTVAVWTGIEMIVWGGYDGTTYFNTGGKYDPMSDSWDTVSTGANVPVERYLHSAVWTGTEMIVWGGGNPTGTLNSGGRYRPTSDSWLTTSMGDNCPSTRLLHTAVWTPAGMIIWGGWQTIYVYLNTGGIYDPASDSWTATSTGVNCPSVREYHSTVWTGTEMIVWGGRYYDTDYRYLNTGGKYNPLTNSWTATSIGSFVPSIRYCQVAVWADAEMIVWGGYDGGYLNNGGRYNPLLDSWIPTSTGSNVPVGRSLPVTVWAENEMIVWGGAIGSDLRTSTGGRYNPTTDSWVPTSTESETPSPNYLHSSVWTGSEMIVWGGLYGYTQAGGMYNPDTHSWTTTSVGTNCPTGRNRHTAIWNGSDMLVWGGYGGSFVNTGGRFNPIANSWTPISTDTNCPSARENHTAVWTGNEMIIWGGKDASNYFYSGGRYNAASDSWLSTSTNTNCPTGRDGHSAVWTGSAMIVWGGYNGTTTLYSGGKYDPLLDNWIATSTGMNCPTKRDWHKAIWTGNEMIVWGGHEATGVYLNTGGIYSPSSNSWETTSTGVNVPTGRQYHTGLWTGTEMLVWGGYYYDTSWHYENTGGKYCPATNSWFPTSTGNYLPCSRYGHTAVWANPKMIVWGGYNGVSSTSTGGLYSISSPMPLITGNSSGCESVLLSTGSYSSYQWNINGSSITGANSQNYSAIQSGDYTVTVTDADGCIGTSAEKAVSITAAPIPVINGQVAATFVDDDTADFNSGTFSNTMWDGTNNWLVLTSAGMTAKAGQFTSRVFDTQGLSSWESLSWLPQRPFGKDLPDYGVSESGYPEGNANMTGNIFLMHLDESPAQDGTVFHDTSSTGYDGSLTTNDGTTDKSVDGILGRGIYFDGIDDGILNSEVFSVSGTFTMECWIYPSTTHQIDPETNSGTAGLYNQRYPIGPTGGGAWGSGHAGAGISAGTNGISVYEHGTGYIPALLVYQAPISGWTHVVVVYETGRPKLYVNGTLVRTGLQSTWIVHPSANTIGWHYYGYFPGGIDEVAVFNRALSPTEISDHYQRGALRLKFQTRACDDPACSGKEFVGPDGTASTFYSEQDNVSLSPPTFDIFGDPTNQYFQYKAYLETDVSTITPALQTTTITRLDPSSPLCVGDSYNLSTSQPFVSYQWLLDGTDIPGATQRYYETTTAGNYSVRVTGDGGCTGTSSPFTLIFDPVPTPTITGDYSGCDDSGVLLQTESFATYQWYKDGVAIPSAISQSYTAMTSGSYSVMVTNASGCEGTSSTHSVTVNSAPLPTITGPEQGCDSVILSTETYATYQWMKDGEDIAGAVGQSLAVSTNGTYSVRVTTSEDCTGTSAAKTVTIYPSPSAPSVSDLDPCSSSGIQITWSPASGATGYDLFVDASTILPDVANPYIYTPGDTDSHSYQIRAKNAVCTGAWSPATSGTDINNTPGSPAITGIDDVSPCAASGIRIFYTPGSGAISHDLFKDGSLAVAGYVSGTNYNPGDTSSHDYLLRAVNGTCSIDSPAQSGTDINDGLPSPLIISVVDSDPCSLDGITVTWNTVAGATGYDLFIDSSMTIANVTSPYFYTPGNTNQHGYQVRAVNATCQSAWSSPIQGTDANGVGTPAITGITDLDACAQSGVTIVWSSVAGATGYDLFIDAATIVQDVSSPYAYDPGNTSSHFYQVRAKSSLCTGGWSVAASGTDLVNIPTPTITGDSSNVCPEPTVILATEAGMISYQWYVGTAAIPGANGYQHSASASGNYTVAYTNASGCSGTSAPKAVIVTACYPNIVFDSSGIISQVTGDGDANFDPGEKWSVPVVLRNAGNADATNVRAELAGNEITVCGAQNYSNIAPGGTATRTFEFVISGSFAPCGGAISFNVVNKTCAELTPAGTDENGVFGIANVGKPSSGAPTDIVLTSSMDSYVSEDLPTAVWGSDPTMYVQKSKTAITRQSLVQFDLSAIPAGAVINSATLELNATAGPGAACTLNIHHITSSWAEGTVEWNNKPSYYGTADASLADAGLVGLKSWTMTAVVQAWMNNSYPNYGLLVKHSVEGANPTRTYQFATKENGDSGLHPVLRINYTPPTGGWNCSYTGSGTCSGCSDPDYPVIGGVSDTDTCSTSGVAITFVEGSPATSNTLLVDGLEVATGISSPHFYTPGDNDSHIYVIRTYNGTCFTDSAPLQAIDVNDTPSAPAITGVLDWDGSCSIEVSFTPGAPATRHDLYVDGVLAQSNVASPAFYPPLDGLVHDFSIRAVNGSCFIESTVMSGADTDCGVQPCVAPLAEVIETVNTDKSGFVWTATDAANYRISRGIQSDLAALITSSADFSCYWTGETLNVNISGDDPSGVTGRCYYYLIQGYNGTSPNTTTCMGPAGSSMAGARQVELASACP